MSNLIVKEITFNNVTLIGVQKGSKIFVAVKKICDDLGLNSNKQNQRIKKDEILNEGATVLVLPSNGGNQEVFCIELDCLPLWLTGISSNHCKEEIRPKLKEFKLKAKDVLAEAFLNKKQEQAKLPENYEEALEHLLKKVKENKKLESDLQQEKKLTEHLTPLAIYAQSSLNYIKKVPLSVFGKYLSQKVNKLGRNKISEFLIEKKLLFRNKKGVLEPYSQYLKADSNYQYFNLNPVNYKKPIYAITTVNGVHVKTKVGEEVVTGFQVLILKSGMEKTIELAYKSGLFTNSEYLKVINDLPRWCNEVEYDQVKEFNEESEVI